MWTACFLLLHSAYQQFSALGHKVVINEPLGPLTRSWLGPWSALFVDFIEVCLAVSDSPESLQEYELEPEQQTWTLKALLKERKHSTPLVRSFGSKKILANLTKPIKMPSKHSFPPVVLGRTLDELLVFCQIISESWQPPVRPPVGPLVRCSLPSGVPSDSARPVAQCCKTLWSMTCSFKCHRLGAQAQKTASLAFQQPPSLPFRVAVRQTAWSSEHLLLSACSEAAEISCLGGFWELKWWDKRLLCCHSMDCRV